jgi:RpiB/LacA/LacB family sugar-phosphate isomerase
MTPDWSRGDPGSSYLFIDPRRRAAAAWMKPGFGFMIRDREVDSMRIIVGSDHAGFEMKKTVLRRLLEEGDLEVVDVGSYNTDPVDYPDYAEAVGLAIREGRAERGVIICGSGVGASVAANKLPGVRAGLCHDTYSARQGVEHDDMNVLALGARVIGPELARELVIAFARATFSGEERHRRRLDKIRAIETRYDHG